MEREEEGGGERLRETERKCVRQRQEEREREQGKEIKQTGRKVEVERDCERQRKHVTERESVRRRERDNLCS